VSAEVRCRAPIHLHIRFEPVDGIHGNSFVEYWVRPAFWSCGVHCGRSGIVSVTMWKPAARRRFRLSSTSGCAGINEDALQNLRCALGR